MQQALQLVRLTDRWLNFCATRMNHLNGQHLLSSAINKKGKHGKGSMEVHRGKCSAWYMKYEYYSTSLLIANYIGLWNSTICVHYLYGTAHVKCKILYFLPLILAFCIEDLQEKSYDPNFVLDHFVLLNKLTYSLAFCPLYKFIRENFSKISLPKIVLSILLLSCVLLIFFLSNADSVYITFMF